jgi:hypothetical protein
MSIKEGIVNEIYSPARRNFKRRRIYLRGIDDVWQVSKVYLFKLICFSK